MPPNLACLTGQRWWDEENDANDFCDNERNRIKWSVLKNDNPAAENWRIKEDITEYNREALINSIDYMYGIFWDSVYYKRYDLVFAIIPRGDTHTTNTWNDIWETFGRKEYFRTNVLGNWYEDVRITANFIVNNPGILDLRDLQDNIHTESTEWWTDAPNVNCRYCSSESDCLGNAEFGDEICGVPVGGHGYASGNIYDLFYNQDIIILTNATKADGTTPIESKCNADLQPGRKYRVIIKNWMGVYNRHVGVTTKPCWKNWERKVTILEIA